MINLPDENISTAPKSPSDSGLIPYGWLRAFIYFISFILVAGVTQFLAMLILGISVFEDHDNLLVTMDGFLLNLVSMLAIVLLTVVFRLLIDRKSFLSLGFSFDNSFKKDLLIGFLWGAGLIGSAFYILKLTGQIEVISIGKPDSSIWLFIALFAVVSIQEELTTRGYMLSNLMGSMNRYSALLLTAVIFSVMHIKNPNVSEIGLLNIVLAGLLLGIYYVHKKNLWFPIGMHLSWNLFQGAIFGSPVSGVKIPSIITFENIGDDLITGGSFGFEASIITTLLMILSILLIHFKYRQKSGKPSKIPNPESV